MANPVFVDCLDGVWTLVAENVTAGQVKRADKKPGAYLETYRMHNGAVPTSQIDGVPCFHNSDSELISATAGIDVYIMAVGNDGKVRVDI